MTIVPFDESAIMFVGRALLKERPVWRRMNMDPQIAGRISNRRFCSLVLGNQGSGPYQ
jgi:hypothetical protein